jgi:hypothetical protein
LSKDSVQRVVAPDYEFNGVAERLRRLRLDEIFDAGRRKVLEWQRGRRQLLCSLLELLSIAERVRNHATEQGEQQAGGKPFRMRGAARLY